MLNLLERLYVQLLPFFARFLFILIILGKGFTSSCLRELHYYHWVGIICHFFKLALNFDYHDHCYLTYYASHILGTFRNLFSFWKFFFCTNLFIARWAIYVKKFFLLKSWLFFFDFLAFGWSFWYPNNWSLLFLFRYYFKSLSFTFLIVSNNF